MTTLKDSTVTKYKLIMLATEQVTKKKKKERQLKNYF